MGRRRYDFALWRFFRRHYTRAMRFLSPLLLSPALLLAIDEYKLTADHEEKPDVPHGVVTKMPPWESEIFPKTTRDWWLYVPAQYNSSTPRP
jgi:enterochelin esterase family protein